MSNEVINPYQTFFDDAGIPLANGTISFLVNTDTALATIFSDEALSVAQANPYPLDASGRIAGDVKYTGLRTLLIKTDLGATVRTIDNVSTTADSTADNLALITRTNPDTLAIALADATIQQGDILKIKVISAGKSETTTIFDVIAFITEDKANGIYTHTADNTNSFQMRDRNQLESDTLAIAKAREDIKIGSKIILQEHSTGKGGKGIWDAFAAGTFTVSSIIFDVFDHDTLPLQLKLRIPDDGLNLLQIGTPFDGTDALPHITAAMFNPIVNSTEEFSVNNTILVPSNTTINNSGRGSFKAIGILSPLEVIITPDTDTENIALNHLHLNADNQAGVSCLFIRLGSVNVKAIGTTCINTAHDAVRGGGRALSVHGGGPTGNRDIVIADSVVLDCYEAIDVVADDTLGNTSIDVIISNTTATNCEILIALFTSTAAFPISPDFHNVVINGVVGRNVGRSDTFTRVHGVINSKEGGNTLISNVFVHNDSDYTDVKAVYGVMGKMSNVKISNYVYSGAMSYVYNNRAWDESNPSISNDNISRDLDIDINVVGQAFSPISSALTAGSLATLIRSTFKVKANSWVETDVFDFAVEKYLTVYTEIMNTTEPRKLTGMMSSLNSIPFSTTGSNSVVDINGALMMVDSVDGKTYRALLVSGVLGSFSILN
jgi:hypothetical protein